MTLLETGMNTMTGGRLLRAMQHVGDEDVLMTYGDGVANLDIAATVKFHHEQKTLATITAVQPEGRFGMLELDEGKVCTFQEKPAQEAGFINGGYMVLNHKVKDYLTGDSCILERDPLQKLAEEGKLSAYRHPGFWQCMDTYREFEMLNKVWDAGNAPWKCW